MFIDDTSEALDRLVQTKDKGRRPGEFTVAEAIERHEKDGVEITKGQMIQKLKRLVNKGELERRKVYFDGRRWTLFWWIK
jgi:DNA-binding MarR family transcriptional regulator